MRQTTASFTLDVSSVWAVGVVQCPLASYVLTPFSPAFLKPYPLMTRGPFLYPFLLTSACGLTACNTALTPTRGLYLVLVPLFLSFLWSLPYTLCVTQTGICAPPKRNHHFPPSGLCLSFLHPLKLCSSSSVHISWPLRVHDSQGDTS